MSDWTPTPKPTMARSAFQALDPMTRAKFIREGGTLYDAAPPAPPKPPEGSISRKVFDALPNAAKWDLIRGGGRVHD